MLNAASLQLNRVLLDRLQEMGIRGVVIDIKFPVLEPDFPHSTEYLNLYKENVADSRLSNIKVLF